MAAKTSRIEAEIGTLTLLFGQAAKLIKKGQRAPVMIDVFYRALQLFKENRLASVEATCGDPRMSALRLQFRKKYTEKYPNGVPISILKPRIHLPAALAPRSQTLNLVIHLVIRDRQDLAGMIGEVATAEAESLLEPHGLYLGMPEDEVLEAFGIRQIIV